MENTNINGAGVYTLHATDIKGKTHYYTVLISGYEPFLKFETFYCHRRLELVSEDVLPKSLLIHTRGEVSLVFGLNVC